MSLSRRGAVVAAGALIASAVGAPTAFASGDTVQPIDFTHNVISAPAPVPGVAWANGPTVKPGTAICTTATQAALNVNTDCEENGPHNETSIAVNPTDPKNMIGGANDYQLSVNPGGHVGETILSRAHVTVDGGKTWTEYPLYSNRQYQATGDPALAFDATGHAYYATLGFRFVGPANTTTADVLVANSPDKGKTWDVQRVAAEGGNALSVGDFLDKEYITAWGSGNVLVTWGDFAQVQKGAVVSAQIYSSVSHDYGKTWTHPTVISSSLDESYASIPTVTSNGRVFVAFMNTDYLDPSLEDYGRDTYRVVELDPATGAPKTQPVTVGEVYDGLSDYPWALGRTTYADSAFRTWAAGNITADPTNPDHLAVVWSDMRNSPTYKPYTSPYKDNVTTNSDVVVSESTDGGKTWSDPAAIERQGDQFMPWGAFDASGALRIGFFDRSYDPDNHRYGYTLATGKDGAYSFTQVTTELSQPTQHDRWFARTLDSHFPRATAFLGDYSNIAVMPDGSGVVAYWTDMRQQNCWALPDGCGLHGEDAFFAKVGG